MNHWFLIRCYLVGVLAASGVGPIFILTFNRGAVQGFLRGFATALAAAVADGFFFFLALVGMLAALQDSRRFMAALDFVGGVLLLFLGITFMQQTHKNFRAEIGKKEPVISTFFRSLFLTLLNPMTVLFFTIVVTKILPDNAFMLMWRVAVMGGIAVSIGSLSVLSTVSLIATFVGHRIGARSLRVISFVTGFMFLAVSGYLLTHFGLALYRG